ncbi:hypothetical protein K457DRAFT_140581 [Linnemannia elongata AG-77]|uniref:Secreted protein n=1 Tax=Linnemannia elongata AG-77 TaxID=1314771 RepID=A0A197JLZ6_9FUNG|nr:hypothetical protein K457DRAFT_140581 [Linnemannia elongata AG-77]
MEGLTFSIVLFYIFLFLPSTHNQLADSSRLLYTDTHTHTLSHTHAIYCTFSPRNYILLVPPLALLKQHPFHSLNFLNSPFGHRAHQGARH